MNKSIILKKILSVILGFGITVFLSSVFAKLQGYFFPQSLEIFGLDDSSLSYILQLIIKILCVLGSGIIGGFVTAFSEGTKKESFIVGVLLFIVVGWLWINTVHPLWFWLLLMSGIIPAVIVGHSLFNGNKK